MDIIEEESARLMARKEATLEKGRALQQQVALAKQEVQRLAGLVAETKEGEDDERTYWQRAAEAAFSRIPSTHPKKDAVASLLRQLVQLLESPDLKSAGSPGGVGGPPPGDQAESA